jgi:ABC-2 type transport system ATP-binding protein
LIKNLAGDHTVILSSHILPEVSQLCGWVIIINHGQIVAGDTPENLSRQLGQGARLALTVSGPEPLVLQVLRDRPEVKEAHHQGEGRYLVEAQGDVDLRPHLARLMVQQGWDLLELKALEFTLEEVFLNLVTKEEAGEP